MCVPFTPCAQLLADFLFLPATLLVMNEVLHANIFFIIASVATVVFCILVSLILYHVFKIIRSVRVIVERVEAASEKMAEDVAHVRELVANGGLVSRLLKFFMGARSGRRWHRTEDDEA